jgi:hypothetical protein
MDQSAVTTAPTTSACAAIASIVLAVVSNMRMGWSPVGHVPDKIHLCASLLHRNKRAQQSYLHAMQSCVRD